MQKDDTKIVKAQGLRRNLCAVQRSETNVRFDVLWTSAKKKEAAVVGDF